MYSPLIFSISIT